MLGTIKKLTDKNFGFITPSEGGKDVFFHASELNGVEFSQLHEGDNVNFELNDTPKGLAASQIALA